MDARKGFKENQHDSNNFIGKLTANLISVHSKEGVAYVRTNINALNTTNKKHEELPNRKLEGSVTVNIAYR